MTTSGSPALSPRAAAPEPHLCNDAPGTTLPRRLGLWTAVSVVVGNIIGSGIFRVPGVVAGEVGSAAGIALVWMAGGLLTLCGALALAELAAAIPRPGGVFVYLNETYGRLVAFLFGWTMLIVAPAGCAAVALVFAEYLGTLVPLGSLGVRMVAGCAIFTVAATGYRSVGAAGLVQRVAAAAKVAALAALVIAAFVFVEGTPGGMGGAAAMSGATRWSGLGVGLVAALWAYNGWQDLGSVAGEVRDPARTLPRALVLGTASVVAIYLATNAAYLHVLPFADLQASPLVAADVMVRLVGAAGAGLVAAMVMVSTFGALNGLALVDPRVFYAMATEGLLFAPLARVHTRYATPYVAIAGYTGLALAYVAFRSFEELAAAFVLGVWPFLALAVAAVLVLRRTRPELHRPYRMPGYPYVPLLFVGATLALVVDALVHEPRTTLLGLGLTLLGIPVYWAWTRLGARAGAVVPLP